MATKKKSSAAPTPAGAVDEQLARYRSMRDFEMTAEPSGARKSQKKSTATRGLPFVIQKHAASHLHYDFRLGWNGVLKSWAIAKGPSYVTKDRRLAIQVEDHPMEYGGFEGIIPQGQYGGGTVMVWDQGTWWPQPGHENVEAGLHDGSLKFEMNGSKMKGKWTLVRMEPRSNSTSSSGSRWSSSTKPQWLLIKEHDSFERGPDTPCITDEKPNSAITGRTLEQIANQEDHVWNSKETAAAGGRAWFRREANLEPNPKLATQRKTPSEANHASANGAPHTSLGRDPKFSGGEETGGLKARPIAARTGAPTPEPAIEAALHNLPKEKQPAFLPPQLALEAAAPPIGDGWLHELKLDGYRIQARKSGSKIQLLTRKGLDWTHRMPAVAAAVARLPVDDATFDGEVVVLATDGNSSFADLQASFNDAANHPLTYFAFDLLHLDGHNTRELPLRERKQLLASILQAPAADGAPADPAPASAPVPWGGALRLSEDIEGSGDTIFHHACELHAEGIISKRAAAPYRSSRSSVWLKSKCLLEQEFVIAGYTPSREAAKSPAGPARIGSLLLGYYSSSTNPGAPVPSPSKDLNSEAGDGKTPKDSPQRLIYAGRTGTGFSQTLKRDLLTRLTKLEIPKAAFDQIPATARRDAHWVKPQLVAQVRFATWTADNLVRQAAFLGLREDKAAAEVVREGPAVAPRPKSGKTGVASSKFSATPKDTSAAPAPASATHRAKPAQAARIAEAAASPQAKASHLRLTHPEKVLDPATGLTKRQLADFYLAVAGRMLPHIVERPLSLVRCPEGSSKPCFFQKHVTAMLPPGIDSVMVTDKKSGKPEPYITLDPGHATPEILAGFAQMGVLEIHPWSSRNGDLEHPDRLIFDLDPDESLPWSTLTATAAEVRKRLKQAGLESFLKLTGGKGLHIVAPIGSPKDGSTLDWATVKDAAHRFVLRMERDNPSLYLTKMTKAARAGKIYLDYLRNERGATAVAPYSPRARPGAHVSLPLPWTALKQTERPVFSVHDFPAWQDRLRSDPWKAMLTTSQQLDPKKF